FRHLRLGVIFATPDLLEIGKALGKVCEQFGDNFAFIAAWPQNSSPLYPSPLWFGVGAQSSKISRVKRLWSFMPAAPSNVRMALAVRHCRPITFHRSSVWSLN